MDSTLLGAVEALYDVDDQMGVELMGAPAWNGLKRAVVKHTAKVVSKANPWKVATTRQPSSFGSKVSKSATTDPLTKQLFGFNDQMGEELLGGWWTSLKKNVSGATHSVLNAGSKVPYVSDAVKDVRAVANIFKKSNDANDSANAVIDSAGEWIKENKIKIIVGSGLAIGGIYLLTRKKGRRR